MSRNPLSESAWTRLGLIAILWLAAFLRLHDLGVLSLWTDEGWTVYSTRMNVGDTLFFLLANDPHPPLYHFIHKITLFFGSSEFAVRWPSAMFGVLGVAAVARVGREWFGRALTAGHGAYADDGSPRRAGMLVAAGLLAVSPFAVWYGREARTYALVVLLTIETMRRFAQYIGPGFRGRRDRVAFVLVSALLYLSHYFGLMAAVVQLICFLVTFRRTNPLLRQWVLMQCVAAVPIGLWLVALFRWGVNFGIGWIPQPAWYAPWLTLQAFVFSTMDNAWLTAIFVAVALAGAWSARHRHWLPVAAAWSVAPLLITLLISFRRPLYVDRYFIGSLPAFMMLVAAGLLAFYRKRRWLGVGLGGLLIGVMSVAAVRTWDGPKEDWRAVASYLSDRARPADVVVMRSIYYLSMNYYYTGPHDLPAIDAGWDPPPPQALAGQRLWLVYRGSLGNDPPAPDVTEWPLYQLEADSRIQGWLRQAAPSFVEGREFHSVSVLLYEFSP
jgi:uncharacterized membrane protein